MKLALMALKALAENNDIFIQWLKRLNIDADEANLIREQILINIHFVVRIWEGNIEDFAHIVLYPSSARGDMNAYKYVNCAREGQRVFTVIYFIDKSNDKKNLVQNSNMRSFREHLTSSPFVAENDYIFLPHKLVENLRHYLKTEIRPRAPNFWVDYTDFDSWVYQSEVLKAAQTAFLDCSIDNVEKYSVVGNFSYLVILNINGRISDERTYNAREQRHSSDLDVLNQFIQTVLIREGFCVMLTGDRPEGLMLKERGIIDATALWRDGLDRFQQRALMYQVTYKYKATLYLGMQSGVNEDAVLLHNTNVFSICENVGSGQVGLKRVNHKMTVCSLRGNYHNFFTIKRNAFLTSTGQFAAFQLQRNQLASHKINFNTFKSAVDRLRAQLESLGLIRGNPSVISNYAEGLASFSFDPQSDDESESELEDEESTFLRDDGFVVPTEQAISLQKQMRFKKISKQGFSKRGTRYTAMGDGNGRFLRNINEQESLPVLESGKSKGWHSSMLSLNEEESLARRLAMASLVIDNLMSITNAVCCLKIQPEKGDVLFGAIFDNVRLLESVSVMHDEITKYEVIKKCAEDRVEPEPHDSGYLLSVLGLQTVKQEEEYQTQLAQRAAKKVKVKVNAESGSDEEYGASLFDE